jgi:hypothetical protein
MNKFIYSKHLFTQLNKQTRVSLERTIFFATQLYFFPLFIFCAQGKKLFFEQVQSVIMQTTLINRRRRRRCCYHYFFLKYKIKCC